MFYRASYKCFYRVVNRPKIVPKKQDLYIPNIPPVLPITKWASQSERLREYLVFEEEKRMKPRLSWYDPTDTSWVPHGWFKDGLVADFKYYTR